MLINEPTINISNLSNLGINPKIIAIELNIYYHNISKNKKRTEQIKDLRNPRKAFENQFLNWLYLDTINFLFRNKKTYNMKSETISLVAKR